VRKLVTDMKVPPVWRRWLVRGALSLVVALAIANLPFLISGSDGRAERLRRQLDDTRAQVQTLERTNRQLLGEVESLRTDPTAAVDRARHDLGLVFPDELVVRIEGGTKP
jgi:cell division protein FtsB